uniref:Uncharacterized protein n=1 Tax=Oryza brachyantha TaxID=4533 RepID=J3LCP9_ORYBR
MVDWILTDKMGSYRNNGVLDKKIFYNFNVKSVYAIRLEDKYQVVATLYFFYFFYFIYSVG